MRLAVIFSLLLSLILSMTASAEPPTPQELQKRLAIEGSLYCDFAQQRFISGMARPLRSSGNLLISKKEGLTWKQEKPFKQTLRITEDKIMIDLEGQPPEVVTAGSNPQLFQFNRLVAAIFNADSEALSKSFQLTIEGQEGKWQLELQPVEDVLKNIFKRIVITGDRYIEGIRIEDKQGDSTVLKFSNHVLKSVD